jgi:hypothetical protein
MARPSTARVALGIAIAALALTATGAAAANGGGGGKGRGHRIVVYERATTSFVDLTQAGPTPGDEVLFQSNLFSDPGFTNNVGTAEGFCVLISTAGKGLSHCSATVHLRGGDIEVSGALVGDPSTPFTVAITGGTHRYRGVGGEFRSLPLNATGSDTRDILTLVH